MNNYGNFNLGDEIRNIVQDAVNNRNFNRLNRDIGNVVNGALDEVRRSIEHKRENHQSWNNNSWNNCGSNTWNNNTGNNNIGNNNTGSNQQWKTNDYQYSNNQASQDWKQSQGEQGRTDGSQTVNTQAPNQRSYSYYNRNNYVNPYRQGYGQNKQALMPVKNTVPVGQVSGTLLTVFGTIGSTATALAAIVLGALGYMIGSGGIFYTIALAMLPCFIACMVLSLNGGRIRKRLKRFQRYIAQLHGRNYCLIKDFSSVTGRSIKYTVKDLQRMIVIGMFPEGHIDDKKTCFMLNSESYDQYLKLQDNMRTKDMEAQEQNKEQTMEPLKEQDGNNNIKAALAPEIRKAIDEGRQYVQKIRDANTAIPGEEISLKLDKLEEITGKIFDYVELHPDKFPEIKKFTEYFLPTTLKLLDTYKELDLQPVAGDNISAAKKEIEKTMDTIDVAFENLLDGLFEEAAMDISTDITVLETMLAQEGLTDKL